MIELMALCVLDVLTTHQMGSNHREEGFVLEVNPPWQGSTVEGVACGCGSKKVKLIAGT